MEETNYTRDNIDKYPKGRYIFVSYSHEDKETVEKVIGYIRSEHYRCWYDDGLTAGKRWGNDIRKHILDCCQFIVFISEKSANSEYVLDEVQLAKNHKKSIIPIKLDNTELNNELELYLSRIQAVNFENKEHFYKELVLSLDAAAKEDVLNENDKNIIQCFSKEYYHLIVAGPEDYCHDEVFSDRLVSVSLDRTHDQPRNIIQKWMADDTEFLYSVPAIICCENTRYHGETDPEQRAVYAYITRIQKTGKSIKFAFKPLGTFLQHLMCDKNNAFYFDLDIESALTSLNISAWSIRRANLFEAFKEAGITHLPVPED